MAMKKNNRDYIAQMNKGMKQKLSMLLIACLLFTGYHGLTISGRAEQEEKEQTNEISVSGTQVKVQLLGEDIRRAAKEAIEKGNRVEAAALQGYSGDEDLQKEYAEIFSSEKEVYEIPLDSISEGLSESLAEEEAGLQVFVERDAKDLERLVRKESKESLLLYDKNSQLTQLFPKNNQEETKATVEKEQESGAEEALASDSNIEKTERNTELTGSELITFLYKNKADYRISFQLSVDGNTYPKVVVSPKTQLFKSFLDKLKKEEKKPKTETEEAEVKESKKESAETKVASENTESNEPESSVSSVSLVSTEGSEEETTVAENVTVETAMEASAEEESIAEESTVAEAGEAETTVSETVAETALETKATEVKEDKAIFEGFLQEVIEHYEEFLGELQTARFTQYSLNELGRKSQNVEIEGFATVEVFYEEAAFDRAVVLEAKRLFKPEEEAKGEKLSEEQVKVLKEHFIYDDGASLDIRFVDKNDPSVEVEPLSPVGVRITLEKKALPETVSPDTISIHHLVENDETKEIEKVDTVVQANSSKDVVAVDDANEKEEFEKQLENGILKTNNTDSDEEAKKETITKEFTVDSFSLYQIHWNDYAIKNCPPIRFHYVDKNFNEIGPTVRIKEEAYTGIKQNGAWYNLVYNPTRTFFNRDVAKTNPESPDAGEAMRTFPGYTFHEVYPYTEGEDNLDTIVKGDPTDFFSLRYKYNRNQEEFKIGVITIDDTGFQTLREKDKNQKSYWYWADRYKDNGYDEHGKKKTLGGYVACPVRDFYFVYDINPGEATKRKEQEVKPQNEKYIKDNLDGTYDLTLTSQVKSTAKEKLDLIFLVDVTKSRNLSFDFKDTKLRFQDTNYVTDGTSRKAKIEENIKALVDNLSENPSVDVHYALVGFGGGKDELGNSTNMDPEKKEVKNNQIDINDTPFNDLTYVSSFTASAQEFKNDLVSLKENGDKKTGANYTAAVIGLRYILDGSYSDQIESSVIKNRMAPRADATKIVIMVTDGDPAYSYIFNKNKSNGFAGVFDETVRTIGSDSKYGTFSYQKEFKEGYSYGNGVEFSRVALNQARGILSENNKFNAFYSIGVGNTENWKHLKELTQAHGPNQDRDWTKVAANRPNKYIDAKSALAKGVDSRVFDGHTPDELAKSFKELGDIIAPIKATNITIYDRFSENVSLVENTTLRPEIFKMKDNGIETSGEALSTADMKKLGLEKLIATPTWNSTADRQEIRLTTDPADFALPAGYEIRLTATIKPSVKAYEKLRKGQASDDKGDDRTDLQDIFDKERISLPPEFSNAAMYRTSAGKFGLYTNDEAKFGYKWKGQDKSKDYKKPIIKVKRADLKIEKTFVGLDKNLVNNSSGVTKFGKKIVQQLKFDILRSEKKSVTNSAKSFLTINFEETPWADALNDPEVFRNGKKVPFTIDGENHEVTIRLVNEANNKPKLSITVDHLDSEKYNYHVWEYINGFENGKAKAISDPDDPQGPKYRYIDGGSPQGPKTIDNTACGIFTFENSYQKEEPKRTVTIKKNVNEFGATAFSTQAKNDVFDFYMVLYNGTEAYDETKTTNFFSNLSSETRGNTSGTTKIKVKEADGSIKNQWVIHFQLTHGNSLSLTMDPNVNFRLFELKKEDYEKATAIGDWTGKEKDFTMPELMEVDSARKYSYTEILSNMGQTITFNNPRISVVPTGLRGDLTPYLFSIFGFTLMAGAYFAINKKKRREI